MNRVRPVPAVGTQVELVLTDDVSVSVDVRLQVGPDVWLAAPPVVHPGRTLGVSWRSGGRTLTASARVAHSAAHEGLCLTIDQAGGGNPRRSGVSRHAPNRTLAAVLESADGGRWTGTIVDLSFGGACVAVSPYDDVPPHVKVWFREPEPEESAGSPQTPGIHARITTVRHPAADGTPDGMLVHVAFEHVGIAAMQIAELLGPARSDDGPGTKRPRPAAAAQL